MKQFKIILLSLVVSSLIISCSSNRNATCYAYDGGFESDKLNQFSINEVASANKSKYSTDRETIDRKVLYSARITLTVKSPDTANTYIEKIAKKYGGYVNELGTYRSVIRVKSENFDNAMMDISNLGYVQSKNKTGQDVTDDYLDYKIRLENAEKSRKRYLELLAKAENVEAALKVEKELERLNRTIDMLKGKMNRINHLSEFSTITISLKEKKKPGPIGYVGIGIYKFVKWFFVRN